MTSVEKIHIEGVATTGSSAAAARKVVLPPLPIQGAWSVSGQVTAVDPVATALQTTHSVVFNIAASGICILGVATETDGLGPTGLWPTQPAGSPPANQFTGSLVTVVLNNAGAPTLNPTAELEFTGSSLAAADWSYELDVVLTT